MGKSGIVKDGHLHASHEAKAQILANLSHLSQQAQVQDECLIPAGTQIVQQFVHHNQQPMVGIVLVERGHHLFKSTFVVGDAANIGKGKQNAKPFKMLFQFHHQDLSQRHGGGTDFDAYHLETPSDTSSRRRDNRMGDDVSEFRVFCQAGEYGHEVRFTGAIVADDQQPHSVGRFIKLQLGDDVSCQSVGHLIGNDVGLDKLTGDGRLIGMVQVDDCFDGVKLDQIAVFHRNILMSMESLSCPLPPATDLVMDIV